MEFPTEYGLRGVVRASRSEPGAPLVLALHGKGMNDRVFERWLRPAIDRHPISWWLPRGILPFETEPSRRVGYAWYVFDGDQAALRASMDEARSYVVAVAETARRALAPPRIALLGFSQGAYLASYIALARPDLFSLLVCCCGRPKAEFADDLPKARHLRILVQTGAKDAAVPPELVAKGVKPLVEAGLSVAESVHDSDHRLTPAMAEEAADFVAGAFRTPRP